MGTLSLFGCRENNPEKLGWMRKLEGMVVERDKVREATASGGESSGGMGGDWCSDELGSEFSRIWELGSMIEESKMGLKIRF